MKIISRLLVAAIASVASAPAANAAVVYTFTTIEPFGSGTLSFTYEAPAFQSDTGFIERSALTNVVGNIERVRFEASCPLGGGVSACDQITVIAGFSSAPRYFANDAFARYGTSATTFGTAATLIVAQAAIAAVPEPATWAMMMIGFGMAAGAARYHRRGTKVVFT